MNIFRRHTKDQHTNSLAHHLPNGRAWNWKWKDNSDGRDFLRGLACELVRSEDLLIQFYEQLDPTQTTDLLVEWEKAVGIPDDCFSGDGTLEERRTHVVVKLASLGVQSADDFVQLAKLFGVDITISYFLGGAAFPLQFPVQFGGDTTPYRFTIIVNYPRPLTNRFPLKFPYPFSDGLDNLIECLFRKLKPANCDIIFRAV